MKLLQVTITLLLVAGIAGASVLSTASSPETGRQDKLEILSSTSASTSAACNQTLNFELTQKGPQGGGVVALQSAQLEHEFTVNSTINITLTGEWRTPEATIQMRLTGPNGTLIYESRNQDIPGSFVRNATLSAGTYKAWMSVFGPSVSHDFTLRGDFC